MMASAANQRGNTLVGFIIGLVVGLGIAVGVALVVTKAPIPFINKVAHAPDAPMVEPSKLPDPNKSLYAKDVQVPADPGPAPTNTAASNSPTPSAVAGIASANTTNAGDKVAVVDKSRPDVPEGKPAFLQAGAYRAQDDAENMRAKLALLGFEAAISSAERDGGSVYRVRLGPYTRIDDLNRVRQRLAENGIDVNVVPPPKTTP
ncbi:MAG: SPOR domain-containing protein [Burkholderiaceae bacterium]|jgi:cell division protein FtsN